MSALVMGIDSSDWSAFGHLLARKSAALVALVVIGLVVQWVFHRLIDKLVSKAEDGVLPDRITKVAVGRSDHEATPPPGSTRRVQRAKTMGTLLKSIVSGIIAAIVITMMLAEVGLNIGPIIASAGIVGVALGFGSQTLVKDFLSGIFMIFEDQFGVGDVVDMGEGLTGTVEAVSLRVTRLRDTNGTVWYVRNGELYRVGNMSQNWARAVLDVQVSAREDVNRVRRVLADVTHDLWEDEEYDGVIIEEPEVWGIEAITPDAITLRVALKTAPMEQWRVARVLRARIKARFDHEGIQAPYPTSYVMNRTPGDPEAAAAADAPDSADDS
ncbi:MAG TPA: mechanosensitive ion channel domain-containing protein [Nocardioides sp.]|jgi:small conductance mechanosensitive channel|nr:mechanosensitive ion channel domain-containing protein [Nocardioides sp.]